MTLWRKYGPITRLVVICLAVVAFITTTSMSRPVFAQGPADWSKAHPDTIINYITWDGSKWTAKILPDHTFLHAPNGDFTAAGTHPDTIINYKTWDGSNWTATIQPDLTFRHAPYGDFSKAHPDSIINYLTWGGSLWTAKIQSDLTFLHAPVNNSAGAPVVYAPPVSHPGPPPPHPGPAISLNVVRVVANQDCYFGGTEDHNQANSGAFGTVFIQKGHSYDWVVSANHKLLYWGAILATGGPMPHMVQRGIVYGGQQLVVP
jgi:hypothetical protein